MKWTAAIFDMDGVMVNTVPLHFQAWKKMAEEYGRPFTFEDYKAKVDGIPRIDGTHGILEGMDDATVREASEIKQTYFLKFLRLRRDSDVRNYAGAHHRSSRAQHPRRRVLRKQKRPENPGTDRSFGETGCHRRRE